MHTLMGLFSKPGIIYVVMSSNLDYYLYQQGISGCQWQTALLGKITAPKECVFFTNKVAFAFINQLMHSIITDVDVKIYVI
jgi:hypothetical protein